MRTPYITDCPICMESKESHHVHCSQCVYTICGSCFDSLASKKCPFCRTRYPQYPHQDDDIDEQVEIVIHRLEQIIESAPTVEEIEVEMAFELSRAQEEHERIVRVMQDRTRSFLDRAYSITPDNPRHHEVNSLVNGFLQRVRVHEQREEQRYNQLVENIRRNYANRFAGARQSPPRRAPPTPPPRPRSVRILRRDAVRQQTRNQIRRLMNAPR